MSSSASPSVSPSMEDVLPIRGIDGNTGEALPLGPVPGLMEGSDPYRVEVVRWAALDVPSIMVEEDLTRMREQYRIPSDVELILPGPNERACFPREGCTALHLNAFVSGLRLPLHPMLRRILRAILPGSDSGFPQMDGVRWWGGMYLWFRHSFGMEMPLHVFQTVYQPRKLPKKKGKEEEVGWYYFCPWGSHKPLVTGCPSSIKQWKESWFWVSGNWQRGGRRPGAGLGCSKCLRNSQLSSSVRAFKREHRSSSVHLSGGYQEPELQLHLEPTALFAEMDQGRRPRPTLAKLAKQRPRTLVPGSAEDSSQRRVIEELSRAGNKEAAKVIEVDDTPETEVPLSRKRKARPSGPGATQAAVIAVESADPPTTASVPALQRTLAVNTAGEVVLEGPSKSTPAPDGESGGSYESKKRLRELIGAPGARIPDDALRSVPFFPSMGRSGLQEVFHSKMGGVFFPRRAGGRAGGQPGLSDTSLCHADEGPG
ncbi:Plus3 domain-containing protein [Abeliophyllum distichum]|uniref:Plus3 domain-containing protein n=1 Tax=Abeliophyllum distichum TaxID=126358 RepID=A0ABD1UHE4_9LAMI